MSKRVWLGWGLAGVCALGWATITSDPKTSSPPVAVPVSYQAVTQAQPAQVAVPQPGSTYNNLRLSASTPTSPAKPATAEAANNDPVVLFTRSDAKLRQSPSKDATVIWTVPKNTAVVSLAESGGWHRVQVSKFTGWMQATSGCVAAIGTWQMPAKGRLDRRRFGIEANQIMVRECLYAVGSDPALQVSAMRTQTDGYDADLFRHQGLLLRLNHADRDIRLAP